MFGFSLSRYYPLKPYTVSDTIEIPDTYCLTSYSSLSLKERAVMEVSRVAMSMRISAADYLECKSVKKTTHAIFLIQGP